ncbi:MAG: hypothetical protein WC812_01415 [Candidatus Pacearchaeota archaeon]|jgi:hypothetical protein
MEKIQKKKTLEMNVYIAGYRITFDGVAKDYKGMYCSEFDGKYLNMVRCNVEKFPTIALSLLENSVKPNLVNEVIINFPEGDKNFTLSMDGYFGRPAVLYGSQRLKSVTKKDRKTLTKIINQINSFEVKGKKIALRTN